MADYISREDAIRAFTPKRGEVLVLSANYAIGILREVPSADVRHVVTCSKCKYNNHCLTQEFVEDNSRIPFDRSLFFCSDGAEMDGEA